MSYIADIKIPEKPLLFILEGADCTGKTTLAKFMARRMRAAYIHSTGHASLHYGMTAYHLSQLWAAQITMESGNSVIMDRHWPSEHCYGSILRPQIHENYDTFQVQEAVGRLHPTYIFCFSSHAADRQIVDPDHTHPYNRSDYSQVYGEYKSLFWRMADLTMGDLETVPMSGRYGGSLVVNYRLETDGANMPNFVDDLVERVVSDE